MDPHNWFIDLRAWSHGGPVGTLKITDGAGKLFTIADLASAVAGVDILLMTHGFENDRAAGTAKLNEWKAHLANLQPMPLYIGVLWPGDCIIPACIDYIWEGSEAQKSGTLLGRFVDQNLQNAASISFGSHSLGARVILQAARQLSPGKSVRHLFTLAAAIEDDTLVNEFKDIVPKVRHISVIYSMQDHVLAAAYPAGNLIGGLIERDDPNVKVALGRNGPTFPLPSNVIPNPRLPDAWKYGHTDYLTTSTIIGDFPSTVDIPSLGSPSSASPLPAYSPTPSDLTATDNWKPCWSADFFKTRWPLH